MRFKRNSGIERRETMDTNAAKIDAGGCLETTNKNTVMLLSMDQPQSQGFRTHVAGNVKQSTRVLEGSGTKDTDRALTLSQGYTDRWGLSMPETAVTKKRGEVYVKRVTKRTGKTMGVGEEHDGLHRERWLCHRGYGLRNQSSSTYTVRKSRRGGEVVQKVGAEEKEERTDQTLIRNLSNGRPRQKDSLAGCLGRFRNKAEIF